MNNKFNNYNYTSPYKYNSYPNQNYSNYSNYNNGDRIFWAPFLVGGLAGTALGYGIANNNYGRYYPPVYYVPGPPPMPYPRYY